ncbi:MAG: aryl-sulfate sulfotransferase, partial [Saprospiraceae bacterium]|nr:aryl-sulfate sulfotransferase [Saprospiraceae bacterium]
MQKILPLLFSLFCLFSHALYSQQWGYVTLVARQNTNSVQLLDTNNMVVKQWSNLPGNTGYSAYMTEGGELWRTVVAPGSSFMGGGICGRVQKVAWNGALLFDYTVSDANQVSHHDICPLPNGNVLLIVYVRKTAAQVQAAGATVNQERWTEKIIELKPTGLNTATIVWEWHLWDHLVQNLYPTKNNYQPSIIDHPELLNINYNNSGNRRDWVHMNGIDYNAELDQIVVSSHYLNELWVIDHSTTTAQAASHAGGNSGKGGDFLYRWGNPAAFGAAGATNFNVVHDAHWVPADCPRAGWLCGFNNYGVSNSVSAVDLFQPPWDGTQYTHTPGQAYLPATFGYRHQANGFSSNMSSSQQLPNGNMLICLATSGKIYEINANGDQIWQYSAPASFIPQASRYSRCYLENPLVNVNTPDPAICSGGSTALSITASATNVNSYTYAWSPSDGLSNPAVANPVVSGITDSTVYTVTVTTAGGCTTTASVTVAVFPTPD